MPVRRNASDHGRSAPGDAGRPRSCPVARGPSACGCSSPASRATASSPSPAAPSGPSATAGCRRSGPSGSSSATARACRSSRRCRGRWPAGRARGVGGAPLIRRATIGTRSSPAVLVTGRLVAAPWLVKDLFDDQVLLLVGPGPAARRATRSSTSCGACWPGTRGSALRDPARRRGRQPAARDRGARGCGGRDRGSLRNRARGRAVCRRADRAPQPRGTRHARSARAVARAHARVRLAARGLALRAGAHQHRPDPRADPGAGEGRQGDGSVPREPRDRAHPRLPLPGGAGRVAPAPRRSRGRGPGARPRRARRAG